MTHKVDVLSRADASKFICSLLGKEAGLLHKNYSILNRIALNLLKNEKTTKVGVRRITIKSRMG
jgi:hypothetical protein